MSADDVPTPGGVGRAVGATATASAGDAPTRPSSGPVVWPTGAGDTAPVFCSDSRAAPPAGSPFVVDAADLEASEAGSGVPQPHLEASCGGVSVSTLFLEPASLPPRPDLTEAIARRGRRRSSVQLDQFDAHDRPIKSGWLLKRGRIFKSWKRRWFVLDREKLTYYTNPKSTKPQGIILGRDVRAIEDYQSMKHGHVGKWPTPYRFVIFTKNMHGRKRRFYLCASESTSLGGWGTALRFYLLFMHAAPDWNGHFQTLRTEFRQIVAATQALKHLRAMKRLMTRFEQTATVLATNLVHELSMSRSQQSIPPVRSDGGSRPGHTHTYSAGGLYVQVAVDTEGALGGDTRAGKVAGHARRGLQAYIDVPGNDKLCFPLALYIDYCGYRVSVFAGVPLSADSLVYGSRDNGRSAVVSNTAATAMMRRAARSLHLKAHNVGKAPLSRRLHASGNVECHLADDTRIYLLNTARALPPAMSSYFEGQPGDVWVNRLRAEHLSQHRTPLCPDAGTVWASDRAQDHVQEVKHATMELEQCTIPRLAAMLVRSYCDTYGAAPEDCGGPPEAAAEATAAADEAEEERKGRKESQGDDEESGAGIAASMAAEDEDTIRLRGQVQHLDDLMTTIHRCGVNLRYLGLIRQCVGDLIDRVDARMTVRASRSISDVLYDESDTTGGEEEAEHLPAMPPASPGPAIEPRRGVEAGGEAEEGQEGEEEGLEDCVIEEVVRRSAPPRQTGGAGAGAGAGAGSGSAFHFVVGSVPEGLEKPEGAPTEATAPPRDTAAARAAAFRRRRTHGTEIGADVDTVEGLLPPSGGIAIPCAKPLPSLDLLLLNAHRLRRHLLTEMVARIVKNRIKVRMRSVMRASTTASTVGATAAGAAPTAAEGAAGPEVERKTSEKHSAAPSYSGTHGVMEPVVLQVVQAVNEVFEQPSCTKFWSEVPSLIAAKYVDGVSEDEAAAKVLFNGVDHKQLFARVQLMCGACFVSSAMDIALAGLPLTPAYVKFEGVTPTFKRLSYFTFEEGYALLESVLTHECSRPVRAVRAAMRQFREAVRLSPGDHRALNMWGLSHRLLVDYVSSAEAKHRHQCMAVQHYAEALTLHTEFPEALTNLGNMLCDMGHKLAGCSCFASALVVSPQFANAFNALAFHVGGDSAVAGGVPQMKRLLMEVAGRTAVLKDELSYTVRLLREAAPTQMGRFSDMDVRCLRFATASERAMGACNSGLVHAALRVVAEEPLGAASVDIALFFLERVHKLYDVVWPTHQLKVPSAAARRMCQDARATGVLERCLHILNACHPNAITGGTWHLPAVHHVMKVLPLLAVICGDRALGMEALDSGLIDAVVPWFASTSTTVRSSLLCLLTKFADFGEGLAAFRRVSLERAAEAGLYVSEAGAGWVALWVNLSRHPHTELRRVASESLRSCFNCPEGTELMVKYGFVRRLAEILRQQLRTWPNGPPQPDTSSAHDGISDANLVVETLETLTWATHVDAGELGVKAAAAEGVGKLVVPFLSQWYPAQTRFLAASVLLNMSDHEVGRRRLLESHVVLTACREIITGVFTPVLVRGRSHSRGDSFSGLTAQTLAPPPEGDISQVVLHSVKLYLNLMGEPGLVAQLRLPPAYSLWKMVFRAIPGRRYLLFQVLASIASDANASRILTRAGSGHQLKQMLEATLMVPTSGIRHSGGGGGLYPESPSHAHRVSSYGRRGSSGSVSSAGSGGDGRRAVRYLVRARRAIRNVGDRQLASDVVMLIVVITASPSAALVVCRHPPLMQRLLDVLEADPMDSHVLQVFANLAQTVEGRAVLLGPDLVDRFFSLLMPALSALGARLAKRHGTRRDSDASSISGWSDLSSSAGGSWGGVLTPLAHSNTSHAAATCVDCLVNLSFVSAAVQRTVALRHSISPDSAIPASARLAVAPPPPAASDILAMVVELVGGQAGAGVQLYAFEWCTRLVPFADALRVLLHHGLVAQIAHVMYTGVGTGDDVKPSTLCARALRLLVAVLGQPLGGSAVLNFVRAAWGAQVAAPDSAAAAHGGSSPPSAGTGGAGPSSPPTATAAGADGPAAAAGDDGASISSGGVARPRKAGAAAGGAADGCFAADTPSWAIPTPATAEAATALLSASQRLLTCFDRGCQADAATFLEIVKHLAAVEAAAAAGGAGGTPETPAAAAAMGRLPLGPPGAAVAATGRGLGEWVALVTENVNAAPGTGTGAGGGAGLGAGAGAASVAESRRSAGDDAVDETDDSVHTLRVVAGCRCLWTHAQLQSGMLGAGAEGAGGGDSAPAFSTEQVAESRLVAGLLAGLRHAYWHARLVASEAVLAWCAVPAARAVLEADAAVRAAIMKIASGDEEHECVRAVAKRVLAVLLRVVGEPRGRGSLYARRFSRVGL